MLRVEDSFEFKDVALSVLSPQLRHYHVVEQVFERPLWITQVYPAADHEDAAGEACWRRFVSSSMKGLLGIVLNPEWDRVRVYAVLPGFMVQGDDLQLIRCSEIWEAVSIDPPSRPTWIFDTTIGTFADPEFGLELLSARRKSLRWKDFEGDWDAQGRMMFSSRPGQAERGSPSCGG
ncbi:hypothetical protein [Variovorax atrisoli]|uniref:hypothetical protein n=1 Tax=Variovorax atrisoli TaxID=3394203 RepID=UPI0040403073